MLQTKLTQMRWIAFLSLTLNVVLLLTLVLLAMSIR